MRTPVAWRKEGCVWPIVAPQAYRSASGLLERLRLIGAPPAYWSASSCMWHFLPGGRACGQVWRLPAREAVPLSWRERF